MSTMSVRRKEKTQQLLMAPPTSIAAMNNDKNTKRNFNKRSSLPLVFQQNDRKLKKIMRNNNERESSGDSRNFTINSNSIKEVKMKRPKNRRQRLSDQQTRRQQFATFLPVDAVSSESDVDKSSQRKGRSCPDKSVREQNFGLESEALREFLEKYQSGELCCTRNQQTVSKVSKRNRSNLSTVLSDVTEVSEEVKEDRTDVINQLPLEPEPYRMRLESVCALPEKQKRKAPINPHIATVQLEKVQLEEPIMTQPTQTQPKPIEVTNSEPKNIKPTWKNWFWCCLDRIRPEPLNDARLLSKTSEIQSYGSIRV